MAQACSVNGAVIVNRRLPRRPEEAGNAVRGRLAGLDEVVVVKIRQRWVGLDEVQDCGLMVLKSKYLKK
jgi:hypothetical protein